MSDSEPDAHLGLPAVEQVGYVVRDLDATLALYEPMFGPFRVEQQGKLEGTIFRGERSDCELRIAYGKSGDLEMEFIQPVSGRTPHQEFLDEGKEGIHHVRFSVDDCDATIERLEPHGYAPIWYHDMGFAKSAYLEHASRNGVLLEVLELNLEKLRGA